MLQSLQQTIVVLTERLSAMEDTCCSQEDRLKHRHDDQDDPDHHEGEKRQRLTETEIHFVETVQVGTEQGSGSGTRSEGQGHEREQCMDLVLYDIPRVEKPEEFDEGSPIVPEDWALILDSYEVSEPTDECANTERALVVMQAEIDEILHPDYQPDDQTSVTVPLLTYSVDNPDLPESDIPVRSPPASQLWKQKKFQGKHSKTNLRITSVDRIQTAFFMKVKYSDFMVTREDGQKYCFSEADFPGLEPQDLLFILRDLKTITIRPREVIDALETVKWYTKCAMKLASVEDFQIGLESDQPKINLLKPDLKILSDAQSVPAFTVIKLPEFGMSYVNNKGIMRFIRFNQIARFCDGTLMLLKDKLKHALDQDEKGVQPLDPKYKSLVLETLGVIEERLEYMTQIRYFEINFRFRKIYIPNWRDFQLLFKGGDC
ncbi:hypothetical protein L6452_40831 [Arctium lappa]|uniref:Uncharacterized protein n=1 Tax=Arctium lappa TaxID=4217 RepID=A0ACB8XNI0_ARCLA|nr:hypothetical protein L6452_40831 [Arctium lappa]